METKDLVLLMLIPIILVSLVVYTDKNPVITGAVTAKQEESNIIGTYSIMPSFKAKIEYNLKEEYAIIKEKLNQIIDDCKNSQGIEQCFKDYSTQLNWNCIELKDEAVDILYDFVDKFNECLNLEQDGVVCRFSLDEREIINRPIASFDITLTNENLKTKVELKEGSKVLATEYIDLENLFYTDYDNRDTLSERINPVRIIIEYQNKKPIIKDAFAIDDSTNRIPLSKTFLIYKKDNKLKFVEAPGSSFEAPIPANKIIDLPRTKGFKFCAKTGKQFYAYDKTDNMVKLRDVVYKFAVTYPKQSVPPKPIENLEVLDALKAENSVILTWDKSNEPIKSFSIYYSTKDFVGTKVEDIKKDSGVNKKSVQNGPIEVKDIDLQKCDFNPTGEPCKYSIYNKKLEADKLYYWASKNKYIYLINEARDGVEYNFAVTAVNEEGIELNNDKSIKDKIYVLTLDKNYKKFTSKDDLAPDKVLSLEVQSTETRKVKLNWNKPQKNIDGSPSVDINGFNIYYKKSLPTQFPELEKIDITYIEKSIKTAEANCGSDVKLPCEYTIGGLEQGQIYNFAITAIDKNSNKFIDNADVRPVIVS